MADRRCQAIEPVGEDYYEESYRLQCKRLRMVPPYHLRRARAALPICWRHARQVGRALEAWTRAIGGKR